MYDESRAATPEEARWFKRLKKCLADMPATVELQVHQNNIQMNVEGARADAFGSMEHADAVDCLDYFQTTRVYPCSESI